ncbi:MAG: hypothetical protein IJ334_09365 [Clostridia bacterium]|nr:hypothetical protein [Clostridia bacterium]
MKYRNILCAVLAAMMLTSCAGGKSPVEHGMEVVGLMDELVGNRDYLSALSGNAEVLEIAAELDAGSYETYRSVYRIIPDAGRIRESLGLADVTMSDGLRTYFDNGALASVITKINAAQGLNETVASSVCTAGRKFVCRDITEHCIYLYTFENGTPIAVVFGKGDDGAVSASGYFILDEDADLRSLEDVQKLFEEYSPDVTVVAGN